MPGLFRPRRLCRSVVIPVVKLFATIFPIRPHISDSDYGQNPDGVRGVLGQLPKVGYTNLGLRFRTPMGFLITRVARPQIVHVPIAAQMTFRAALRDARFFGVDVPGVSLCYTPGYVRDAPAGAEEANRILG